MPVAWITEIYNNSSKPVEQWCNQPYGDFAHLGVFTGIIQGKDTQCNPGQNHLRLDPGDHVQADHCAIPWYDGKHYRYLQGDNIGVIRLFTGVKDVKGEKIDCIQMIDDVTGKKIDIIPYAKLGYGPEINSKFALFIEDDRVYFELRNEDSTGEYILSLMKEYKDDLKELGEAAIRFF